MAGAIAAAESGPHRTGVYLIAHAFQRIHHYDRLIEGFKRKHSKLAELLE